MELYMFPHHIKEYTEGAFKLIFYIVLTDGKNLASKKLLTDLQFEQSRCTHVPLVLNNNLK